MGQRVLITAGASGIGRAIAETFASGDAQVWIADVDAGHGHFVLLNRGLPPDRLPD